MAKGTRFDRMSDKEFNRFLYIALGSCSEVKSMLYLSNRLNYSNDNETEQLINQTNEIGRIIRGLIKSLAISNKYYFFKLISNDLQLMTND